MGRPPKPIEHHQRVGRANGTKKADGRPIGVLAVVPQLKPVPLLDPKATLEQVVTEGYWLAYTDAAAVALLRESLEERAVVRQRAMAGSSEARKELRDLDKQIISQLSALGFDPTARARLGVAEVTRVSKLADLQAKSKN
jgi:hypothetical protein